MEHREKWTDPRLDDLSKKVDEGFARTDRKMDDGFARADKRMDAGFARADKKMDDGFARVDANMRDLRLEMKEQKDEVTARFAETNGHLLALHRLLIRASIGGAVAFGIALIGMFR